MNVKWKLQGSAALVARLVSWAAALAAAALLSVALDACNRPSQPQQAEPVVPMSVDRATVVFTTEPRGSIAPCGCTSNPLGGIAKMAAWVEQLRRSRRDVVLVSAGNFLVEAAQLPEPNRQQEEAKAGLVAETYQRMGVLAQTPGPFDTGFMATRPDGAWTKSPWLGHGETRVAEFQDMRLLFVGVTRTDAAALSLALATHKPGKDAVIGLSSLDRQTSRALAQQAKGFDVIIAADGGEPRPPQRIGDTLLVDAGELGQYLGVLDFVRGAPRANGGWSYYDAGENELAQLRRQLASLEQELAALPANTDPAARTLRLNRRDELAKQITELEVSPPKPPEQRHIRFSALALSKKHPDDATVAERVKAYNQQLCKWSERATAELKCPEVAPGEPSYLGSQACAGCHSAAFAQWQTQKHAHAVKTLEDAGKFCDLSCIGCHTTGFNQAGGFCSPQKVGAFKEVGCEMCHGPGSLHVQKGGAKVDVGRRFTRAPDASVCVGCHTKEHSDTFEFNAYRQRILGPGHGGR